MLKDMETHESVSRARAARGAVNLSLDAFAELTGVSRSTLVRIENGSREPKRHEWEAIARASGLPIEFFVVDDLHVALAGADRASSLLHRVEELEARVQALIEVLLPTDRRDLT